MNSSTQNESGGTTLNGTGDSGWDSRAGETMQDEGAFSGAASSAFIAADEYVRRSPWLLVGVAAIAGAAVGVLLSGPRKDVDG